MLPQNTYSRTGHCTLIVESWRHFWSLLDHAFWNVPKGFANLQYASCHLLAQAISALQPAAEPGAGRCRSWWVPTAKHCRAGPDSPGSRSAESYGWSSGQAAGIKLLFSEAEGKRNVETLVAELKKHHLKCTLDAGIFGETWSHWQRCNACAWWVLGTASHKKGVLIWHLAKLGIKLEHLPSNIHNMEGGYHLEYRLSSIVMFSSGTPSMNRSYVSLGLKVSKLNNI